MVARFHYDHEMYEQFLHETLPQGELQEMARHCEQCASCQEKLEDLAQRDWDWGGVTALLDENGATPAPTFAHQPAFLERSPSTDMLGRFGRYEIVEVLGSGGMGVVMRGHDAALARDSAIKVLAPHLAQNAAARKRFAREAKSAAAVVHEHVVPIQTVDEHDGLPYLVMPVVEGWSLQERVEQQGPLELTELLRIGMQIARGLAAAHAQGLVHRDVKPGNVLLENGVERVLLTDFGLARAADDAQMTQSGVLAGTPEYMSPEQAQGTSLDHRSDLFSLGSVLTFMATGRSPFRAETTMGVLTRIVHDTPRPLPEINAAIPSWLQRIVERLLAKDPADRYDSAEEVASLLAEGLAHVQQPTVVPAPLPGFSRSRWSNVFRGANWTWFAGALAAFSMGLLIVWETSKGTITIESARDGVALRITQGEQTVKRLTVNRGVSSTRIQAGHYVVEVEGDVDGLQVESGTVELLRRGAALVKIRENSATSTMQRDPPNPVEAQLSVTEDTPQSVRLEFLPGTETFVVRGKKNDVARVMSLMDGRGSTGEATKTPTASREGKQQRTFRMYRMDRPHLESARAVVASLIGDEQGNRVEVDEKHGGLLVYAAELQHDAVVTAIRAILNSGEENDEATPATDEESPRSPEPPDENKVGN